MFRRLTHRFPTWSPTVVSSVTVRGLTFWFAACHSPCIAVGTGIPDRPLCTVCWPDNAPKPQQTRPSPGAKANTAKQPNPAAAASKGEDAANGKSRS